MKTIREALIDEIIYPIPEGLVDNKLIARNLDGDDEYTFETAKSKEYRGAFADCLVALTQSVNFSEADKSVGALTSDDKKQLRIRANSIYRTIGEPEIESDDEPVVYINCD